MHSQCRQPYNISFIVQVETVLRIQLEYLEALTSGPPNTVDEELEAYRLAVQGGVV